MLLGNECDVGGCGQFAKSERLFAMFGSGNTNASRKVCHFCVLEQLQAVHTESSTRNTGGNLFGTVLSVSCAEGPSASRKHIRMFI